MSRQAPPPELVDGIKIPLSRVWYVFIGGLGLVLLLFALVAFALYFFDRRATTVHAVAGVIISLFAAMFLWMSGVGLFSGAFYVIGDRAFGLVMGQKPVGRVPYRNIAGMQLIELQPTFFAIEVELKDPNDSHTVWPTKKDKYIAFASDCKGPVQDVYALLEDCYEDYKLGEDE